MSLMRRVQSLEVRALRLPLRTEPVEPLPLANPADVLAILAEQVNAVRADGDTDPLEQARTVGLLAGVALRAIESRDLAARLEAIEQVLRLRKAAQQNQRRK